MSFRNTKSSWGSLSRGLHWLVVLLIITQWAIAERADSLPLGMAKISALAWHKSIGITVLMLAVVRLVWRLANPVPDLTAETRPWERVLAKVSHFLLYALIFALPLSGWLMSSARNFPVSWFKLFQLPDLVAPDEALFQRVRAATTEALFRDEDREKREREKEFPAWALAKKKAVEDALAEQRRREKGGKDFPDGIVLVAERQTRGPAPDEDAPAAPNTVEVTRAQSRSVGFDFAIAEECGRWRECRGYRRVYGDEVVAIEYRREDFRRACASVGDEIAIVLRDRQVSTPAKRRYVFDAC